MTGDSNFRIEFDLSDKDDPVLVFTNDYHNTHMLGGIPMCHYKYENISDFISECEKIINDKYAEEVDDEKSDNNS